MISMSKENYVKWILMSNENVKWFCIPNGKDVWVLCKIKFALNVFYNKLHLYVKYSIFCSMQFVTNNVHIIYVKF